MKIEFEFRTFMSCGETFRALQLTLEAATRLRHRMTPEDLQRVEIFGAALIAAASDERTRRGAKRIEFAGARAGDRAALPGVPTQ